jgi:hypothetical protein
MRTRRAVLFGLWFASLLSIPRVCAAQEPIITDFRLTLSTAHNGSMGRIMASARWNGHGPGVLFFELAHEGRAFASSGRRQGSMSASGDARYFPSSYEEFEVFKEDYFSKPQTFTLLAVYNMGDRRSCFSYS